MIKQYKNTQHALCNITKITMLIAACLGTSACTATEIVPTTESPEIAEAIYGVKQTTDTLSFQVVSNGCTDEASFDIRQFQGNIRLVRKASDRCRRLPHKIWIDMEFNPEEDQDYVLTNPVVIN